MYMHVNLDRMEFSLPTSFVRIKESISFTEMDLQVHCTRSCKKTHHKSLYMATRTIRKRVSIHKNSINLITIVQSSLGGYLGLYLGVSLLQVINSISVFV